MIEHCRVDNSPKEEHDRARIVELVHLVEVGHRGDVDEVADAKVLDLFGDGEEGLVHLHAVLVPVVTEPDEHHLVLLAEDRLVHLLRIFLALCYLVNSFCTG